MQAWWAESIRVLGDFHFLDRLLEFDKDSMEEDLCDQVTHSPAWPGMT